MTSVGLLQLVPTVMATEIGTSLDLALPIGNPPCPFGGLTFPTASPLHSITHFIWCRTLTPACHRLRLLRPRLRTRLTLGRLTWPRNPQAFGGDGSHITCATHSGIRTSGCSTSPRGLASWLQNAPLPCLHEEDIHGFGKMLEPRYVLGARALDQ